MYLQGCVVAALLTVTGVSAATNWPVFFEHLGNVHSIHNKWDLTLTLDTRLQEFEIRLRNVSISLDVLRPTFQEAGVAEAAEEVAEAGEEDISVRAANVKAVFSTVQTHWDAIATIFKRRVADLLGRLGDYKALGDRRSFEMYARSRRVTQLRGHADSDEASSRQKRAACSGTSCSTPPVPGGTTKSKDKLIIDGNLWKLITLLLLPCMFAPRCE